MKRLAAWLVPLAALGLLGAAAAQDDHGHDHEGHTDMVVLDAAELEEFGIELDTAAAGVIETFVTLPGEVRANEDRLAHIVPRFAGIVTDVRANTGDRVGKGQVLAVVESDDSLAPYEVKTLIAGTVIEKHITLGEAVTRDHDVYVIADLSTVWVDLTVYQRDLRTVREGCPARILVGHDSTGAAGTVSYVTPVVDHATRTATARLVLPNPEGRWRPGMFVRGRVQVGRDSVRVAVPRTALQTHEEGPVVFVAEGDGFAARHVRIGRAGDDRVEIAEGLEPGERYVSRGGFTLKAELGRDSLGHAGHAH